MIARAAMLDRAASEVVRVPESGDEGKGMRGKN